MLLTLSTCICFSQGKEANIWYFGWGAGIDFNQGSPPIALTNSQMYIYSDERAGSATISDSIGSLLFYTDGITIWNKLHQVMQNGDNMGNYTTQGALIIPKPGSTHLYYYFNFNYTTAPIIPTFRYSLIDMTLDNGLGAVISDKKNITLLENTSGHLSAVLHNNGSDVWIMTHGYYNNKYYAYLLDNNGLNPSPIVSSAGSVVKVTFNYMKFSPDGKRISISHDMGNNTDSYFEILNFSTNNGIVSDFNIIHKTNQCSCVDFSSDNTKLYTYEEGGLNQYNLEAGDPGQILSSEVLLYIGGYNGAFQLAPDGKIYVCRGTYNYLHVINNPNELGFNCNFQEDAIYLEGRETTGGLPSFLQSYMNDPTFTTIDHCLGDVTQLSIDVTNGIDSVYWKFNDIGNFPFDTSTLFSPSFEFSHADTFWVDLTAYSNLMQKTVTQAVVIHPSPEPNLGNDTLFCDLPLILNLNPGCSVDSVFWSTGQTDTSAIAVSDTGWYWAEVYHSGCAGFDSIHIGLFAQPTIDTTGLVVTPANCGLANGSISGIQVNGTQPILFAWLDVAGDTIGNNIDIINLTAGIYTLQIEDGNACIHPAGIFTVTDMGSVQVDSVHFSDDHCFQQGASIHIFGHHIGSGNLSYSIDGGQSYIQNNGVFTGLFSGTYNIMMKDENNCEGIYTSNPVVINNISGPQITAVSTVDETNYNQDGQILINAQYPGSILYSINNGTSFQQDNGLFAGLVAGIYPCIVKDNYGCDTSFTVELLRNSTIQLQAIAGDGSACLGDVVLSPIQVVNFSNVKSFQIKLTYDISIVRCDAYTNLNPALQNTFSANINTTTGEILLNWTGVQPLSLADNSKLAELVFSSLFDGVTAVNWQTGQGESVFYDEFAQQINTQYQTGSLRIYNTPEIQMASLIEVCQGDNVLVQPSVSGGNGSKTYNWSGPESYLSQDSILWIPIIQTNQSGNYILLVNDTMNCESDDTINIIVNPSPQIDFSGTGVLYVEPGYELHSGTGYNNYLWNTGSTDESIIVDTTGEYTVWIISTKGCLSEESVEIRWSDMQLYFPNAFTPDGDGLNDEFAPKGYYDYISQYHLSIYDRWGNLVYETKNVLQGWNGKIKGTPSSSGVYVYKCIYSMSGSTHIGPQEQKGTFVMVR